MWAIKAHRRVAAVMEGISLHGHADSGPRPSRESRHPEAFSKAPSGHGTYKIHHGDGTTQTPWNG